MRHLRFGGEQSLVGHEDGVDDVDDAVGLEDVGCGDGGHAAFGVGEHDLVAGHGGDEIFALDGLEVALPPPFLIMAASCLELILPATTW